MKAQDGERDTIVGGTGEDFLSKDTSKETVDFVTSTDVCEHIPEADLAQIFRECRRLLRPGGAVSCRIDLQDHYAYFDPNLSRYHFLRFSDRAWGLVNSPLHFQNRLREPDYLRLVRESGLEVVSWTPSGPSAGSEKKSCPETSTVCPPSDPIRTISFTTSAAAPLSACVSRTASTDPSAGTRRSA